VVLQECYLAVSQEPVSQPFCRGLVGVFRHALHDPVNTQKLNIHKSYIHLYVIIPSHNYYRFRL